MIRGEGFSEPRCLMLHPDFPWGPRTL